METFFVLMSLNNKNDDWGLYTTTYASMDEFLEVMVSLNASAELDMILPISLFGKTTVTGWNSISTKNSILWINQNDLDVDITYLGEKIKELA